MVDWLGLGDFRFDLDNEDSNGVDWANEYTDQGLFTSVSRGDLSNNTNTMGHHGVLPNDPLTLSNFELPMDFVLTATFVRPEKTPLPPTDDPKPGEYAAVVLFDYEYVDSQTGQTKITQAGVTSRFTDATGVDPQQHLNIVPYGKKFWPAATNPPLGGFPPIDDYWCKQVTADVDPLGFTVVLYVKRSDSNGTPSNAAYVQAWLYLGDNCLQSTLTAPVPEQKLDYMTAATVFKNIRVGVGTSQGMMPPNPPAVNYSASVYLTDFAIWKRSIYYRDFRPREITDVSGAVAWFTGKEKNSVVEHFENLGTLDSDGIALSTGSRLPGDGNTVLGRSAFLSNGGLRFQPIDLPDRFQLRATFCGLRLSRTIAGTTSAAPMGGEAGDAFEAAIVMVSGFVDSEGQGFEHVVFNMQTTDKDAGSRGVRMFVKGPNSSAPDEGDFVGQAAFGDLYSDVSHAPIFTLNFVVNKDASLDSTAYFEVVGHRYDMARPYTMPARFFESGLLDIRALISTSHGDGLGASARLYEFEIVELK